jgi:glycosyltransferase involved in cell wall biosynthesis
MSANTAADALAYTVIIPAYKAAATLGTALDSVFAQQRPAAAVIVIDDGSPDGEAIAAVVAGYDGRVTLIRQHNQGPAAARNHGVRTATTPWIAFLDADDSWLPEKMARQLALAGEDRVGLIHGQARDEREPLPVALDLDRLWTRNRICTSMVVVRKAAFDAAGGFDEDPALIGAEDYNLWLRLAAAGWDVRAAQGRIGNYTPAAGSITSQIERCAAAEIYNARKLGTALGFEPARIEAKVLAIRTDFGRHLLHARDLPAARRMLWAPLRRRPRPAVVQLWCATFVPPALLDLRRKLRSRRPAR